MNWMAKLLGVPLPSRIATLPKDARGFPIPHSVIIDSNGVPDFRVIDMIKWHACCNGQRCGICGQKLTYYKYFIGGPKSTATRTYFDLPMHEECARYALATCPFLAMPRFTYAKEIEVAGVRTTITKSMSDERPEKFGLLKTRGYKFKTLLNGEPGLRAKKECSPVEWFAPSGEFIDSQGD